MTDAPPPTPPITDAHVPPRGIAVLGSTGSIGVSTLRVIEHLNHTGSHPHRVLGLAASSNDADLAKQAQRFGATHLALCDRAAAARLRAALPQATVYDGDDAAETLIRALAAEPREGQRLDVVVGAIVGAAGISASLATLQLGVDLALANKETLVAAGPLVTAAARRSGARILPVDSEHSAIWQALAARTDVAAARADVDASIREWVPPCDLTHHVRRLILTASGGPLRDATLDEVKSATVERVLSHPTWDMGAKVTVDSASLTNKALEVIEGHFLFGLPGSRIDAVVHPQSIVHSLVEYHDGSLLAQLGTPDMTTPIQYALTHPHRPAGLAQPLDLAAAGRLDFEAPDLARFPALGLAYDVLEAEGTTAGAIFNAANEAAVEAFLAGKLRFGDITMLTAEALGAVAPQPLTALDDVFAADAAAREFVSRSLRRP
jgi:1-deoxy-D-xylulose-5-phosphate reductoisomerase